MQDGQPSGNSDAKIISYVLKTGLLDRLSTRMRSPWTDLAFALQYGKEGDTAKYKRAEYQDDGYNGCKNGGR